MVRPVVGDLPYSEQNPMFHNVNQASSSLLSTLPNRRPRCWRNGFTRRSLQPCGNYDSTMVPYGNYPCAGVDQCRSRAAER